MTHPTTTTTARRGGPGALHGFVRWNGRWRWPLLVVWVVGLVAAALVARPWPSLLGGGGGLVRAELVTPPVVLLVLVPLLRSVVAASTALIVGISSIVLSFAVLALLAPQHGPAIVVESTVAMLGLGVGAGHSLLVIAPFTAELRAGRSRHRALVTTLRAAGATVPASAVTIIAAMAVLLLAPLELVRGVALGAVVVVSSSALVTLLLLPPLLWTLGPAIERGKRCGFRPTLGGAGPRRRAA